MASDDPKKLIDAALEELRKSGVDIALLETRLHNPDVAHVIVGPWPIGGDKDKKDVSAVLQTRSLFIDTLQLMKLHEGDAPLMGALGQQVAEYSQVLDSFDEGLGTGALSGDLYRSIVGRWPPK